MDGPKGGLKKLTKNVVGPDFDQSSSHARVRVKAAGSDEAMRVRNRQICISRKE